MLKQSIVAYSELLHQTKSLYYNDIIAENKNNTKELFRLVKKWSEKKTTNGFPEHSSEKALADNFVTYFHDKIQKSGILLNHMKTMTNMTNKMMFQSSIILNI